VLIKVSSGKKVEYIFFLKIFGFKFVAYGKFGVIRDFKVWLLSF